VSIVGILEPDGLLAREIRDQLEQDDSGLFRDLLLFSRVPETVGTLTEIRGAAAIVKDLGEAPLADLELLIACTPDEQTLAALADLEAAPRTLLVSPLASTDELPVAVAGADGLHTLVQPTVVSPHPAVVALSHLLRPLAPLGLEQAVTTLLRPASMMPPSALDEIFEQTRALLAFRTPEPGENFSRQMAFNVLPGPGDEGQILDQLRRVLGEQPRLQVHTLQAPVFHGFAVSLFVQLERTVDLDMVCSRLDEASGVEMAEEPEDVSPIEVVARDGVLVGRVQAADGTPGGFWIWAAFDNLTHGGAGNVLALARAMLGAVPAA
jgi:aspartate-semialdehyde dehydrogenase